MTAVYLNEATPPRLRGAAEMGLIRLGDLLETPRAQRAAVARRAEAARREAMAASEAAAAESEKARREQQEQREANEQAPPPHAPPQLSPFLPRSRQITPELASLATARLEISPRLAVSRVNLSPHLVAPRLDFSPLLATLRHTAVATTPLQPLHRTPPRASELSRELHRARAPPPPAPCGR